VSKKRTKFATETFSGNTNYSVSQKTTVTLHIITSMHINRFR